MLVFGILATLIPSFTTAWISYLQNKRSLTEKITGELQSVSAQTAREMDLWVKERLYELRVFASSYEVSENLDRITRGHGAPALARLTDYLHSVGERFTDRSEEHTSELQSLRHLVCRLLLEKKKIYPAHPRARQHIGV